MKKRFEKRKRLSWGWTLLAYIIIVLLMAPFILTRFFPGLIEEKLAPHVSPAVLKKITSFLENPVPGSTPSPGGAAGTETAPVGVPAGQKIMQPCELVQVFDGDTIKVKMDGEFTSVRFLYINTPEKKMWGCQEATDTLRELLEGKRIALEYEEPGVPARDAYSRLLAYVYADGVNVNIEMVRSGWTSYWEKFGESKYTGAFSAAQQEAESACRGLWLAFEAPGE